MSVDFKSLRHGYGVATKIPALVKRLAGSNEETRPVAFDDLRIAFYKPGEWFSASAATAGLLLESVAEAAAPADVLFILAETIGSDHGRAWLAPLDDQLPTNLVSTISERADALFGALESERIESRAGALLVLAMVPLLRDRALPVVQRLAVADPHELVQASALLALGRLGLGDLVSQQLLAEREANAAGIVRGAAAIARLRAQPERSFAEARVGIRAWLDCNLPNARGTEPRFPWFGGIEYHQDRPVPILSATAEPLRRLAQQRNQQTDLLDLLLEEGRTNASGPFGREATALIFTLAAFPVPKNRFAAHVLLPRDLDPAHLDIATRLAETELAPVPDYGLPGSGTLRKRWLGVLPAGPLEQLIEVSLGGEVKTVPFWFAMQELFSETPTNRFIHSSLEQYVSGIGRWHLIAEYATGAYGKWFVARAAGSAEIERELAFLPKTEAGLTCVQAVADAAAARVHAAKAMYMPLRKIAPQNANMSLILLPWIRAGRDLPPAWEDLIYIGPEPETREILSTLAPERREAFVWRYFDVLYSYNHAAYNYIADVLDLVPSRRITLALLRVNAIPVGVYDSKSLIARIQEVAQREPEVAEAVRAFDAEQAAPPAKTSPPKKAAAAKRKG